MTRKSTLKLLPNENKERDPRISLVHSFNQRFLERTGNKNPMTYGACMNALKTFRYVDEETGEEICDYPDLETWNQQLEGFFSDPFARDQRGFHFPYFIKQFGSFVRFKPVKHQPVQAHIATYLCPDCGNPRTDKSCTNEKCISNQWKHEKGTPEAFQAKLEELTKRMKI